MTSFLKFKKKVGNKMKKISLELQWAVGKKTGVGWYIYNIVKELSKTDKNDYIAEFINFMGRHDVKSQIDYDIKIKQNIVTENRGHEKDKMI